EFKRVGTSWFCISPIRVESNPSFAIKIPEENLWYDFGIGEGGDIIKLVQKIENCTFTEAINKLIDYVGIINERKVEKIQKSNSNKSSEEFAKKFYNSIRKTENQALIKRYFKKLGLPLYPEIGVTEYRSTKDNLQFIVFPCPNPQEIIGLECRGIVINENIEHAINGKKVRKTLGRKVPWVFYRSHEALVTESIIDALSGEVLYGSHLTLIGLNGVGNIKFLEEILYKYQISKVHLALDADEAGELATRKAMEIIPREIDLYIKKDHHKEKAKDLYQLLYKSYAIGSYAIGG
ncbi:MAG: CHC2 zinc finger domain-containing protein, partial [Thermoplasmata archaeon]